MRRAKEPNTVTLRAKLYIRTSDVVGCSVECTIGPRLSVQNITGWGGGGVWGDSLVTFVRNVVKFWCLNLAVPMRLCNDAMLMHCRLTNEHSKTEYPLKVDRCVGGS